MRRDKVIDTEVTALIESCYQDVMAWFGPFETKRAYLTWLSSNRERIWDLMRERL